MVGRGFHSPARKKHGTINYHYLPYDYASFVVPFFAVSIRPQQVNCMDDTRSVIFARFQKKRRNFVFFGDGQYDEKLPK